ncbi:uncharacterized protein LOC133181020 [Saccostrea echinata]|uniref:uncharacterized protein LOC133181020 n=1 Tax=Saccostrea echinata TaxID=191078 RepID=UPI002A806375|nr:uncharacterized protein LOC133181020 [Saccostrea echinata]
MIILPIKMNHYVYAILLIVFYVLCVEISSIYGKTVPTVPSKPFKRGLSLKPEHAETLNIKCTDCIYRDKTDIKIGHIHAHTKHNGRKKHHHRRRNRRKNNKRSQHRNSHNLSPNRHMTSSNMAASDPSAHHVIYPSNHQQDFPQLPAAVARLERRLHPSLSGSISKLKETLTKILQKMKRKLNEMHFERRDSQVSVKDSMMKVREELQHITQENNRAYDAILDVSQLTRMVLLKQKQQGAPAPLHHVKKPAWIKKSYWNHGKMDNVKNESYLVNSTYLKIMRMKTNFVQQDARMVQLNDAMKDGLSDLERLRDLKIHARRVLMDLYVGIENKVIQKKVERYRQFETGIRRYINESQALAKSAYMDLRFAQRTFMDNKDLSKSIEQGREGKNQTSGIRVNTQGRSTDIRTLVNLAYSRSRNLQKSEEFLHRTVIPVLLKARNITHGDGTLLIMVETRKIGARLKSYILKIDRVLDHLRKALGDEDIIEERCHNLLALKEYDKKTSVIDCTSYIAESNVESGSGSGEIELIEPDSSPVPSVLPHKNGTSDTVTVSTDDFIFIDDDNITIKPVKPETTTLSPATTSSTTSSPTTERSGGFFFNIFGRKTTASPTTSKSITTATTTPLSTSQLTSTTKTTSLTVTTSTTVKPTIITIKPSPKTTTSPSTTTTTTPTPSTTTTTTPSTTTPTTTTTTTTPSTTTTTTPSTTSTTTSTTTTTIPSTTTTTTPSTTTSTTQSTTTTSSTTSSTTTASATPSSKTSISMSPKTTTSDLLDTSGSGSGEVDDTEPEEELQPTKSLPTATETILIDGNGKSDIFIERPKKEIISTTTKIPTTTESSSWWDWGLDDPKAGFPNRFRDKLAEKAQVYKSKTVDLFENSTKLRKRIEEINQRNAVFVLRKNNMESFVSNLTEVSKLWNGTKVIIGKFKPRIQKMSDVFLSKVELILNKSKGFSKIAKEKLAEYEGASAISKNDKSRKTAETLTDLLTKVAEIKKNRQDIRTILSTHADPCSKIQTSTAKLRNNIAELRKKIQQAKRISSAMPASLSMDGKDSLSLTVTSSPLYKSPLSTFGFCIKPEKSSMAIATLHNPSSANWVVELEERKPKITFFDSDGNKKGQLKSQTEVELGKWVDLKIFRFGSSILLNRTDLETSTYKLEAKAIPGLSVVIEPPKSATVGFAETKDNFTGCIAEVTLNDERMGLLASRIKKKHCTSNCLNTNNAAAMVFDGTSFVRFSVDMIYQLYPFKEMGFQYKTYQDNGILLLLNDRLQGLQVLVSIMDCRLHVEARINRGTTVVRSTSAEYCNGTQRFVKLIFGKKIEIKTSNPDEVFLPESSTQEITPSIDDGLYLGGLGSQNKMISGKNKLRSIVGCISNMQIQNKLFPFYMAESSRNVHVGNCDYNAWFKCVRFDDNSQPVVLDKGRDAKIVSFAITRDSVGRVLNYKTKHFDIDILVDGKGIEVVDNKEEELHDLPFPTDHDNHWMILTITDKNKRVTVNLNGSSVYVEYSLGWFVGGNTHTSEYTVTVGASGDGSQSFVGGITRLIIDDRETPLDDYRSSHHLQSCRRPLVESLDIADMSEKPVC